MSRPIELSSVHSRRSSLRVTPRYVLKEDFLRSESRSLSFQVKGGLPEVSSLLGGSSPAFSSPPSWKRASFSREMRDDRRLLPSSVLLPPVFKKTLLPPPPGDLKERGTSL